MLQRYEGAQSKSLRARKVFTISAITTGVLFLALIAFFVLLLNDEALARKLGRVGQIIAVAFDVGVIVTVGTGIWYWRSKPKQPKPTQALSPPNANKRGPTEKVITQAPTNGEECPTKNNTLKWVAAVFSVLVLVGMVGIIQQDSWFPAKPQKPVAPTACSEAAKIVSVMLATDGYHVTLPTPSPILSGAVRFGSTDMNKHTVEVVKDALRVDHDLVLKLRAAGCKCLEFYGDNLGSFGADVDLDDLP